MFSSQHLNEVQIGSFPGLCSDFKTYGQLGDVEEPEVVGDGTDDDGDLALATFLLRLTDEGGERQWWPVDAGHEETLQDDVVELGIGTTGQETVELEQNDKITCRK